MAGIIAKLERCGLDAETFRPLDEAPPIGAASEFSVRDNLKPHALLQRHNIANAFILQLFEFGVADLSVACWRNAWRKICGRSKLPT